MQLSDRVKELEAGLGDLHGSVAPGKQHPLLHPEMLSIRTSTEPQTSSRSSRRDSVVSVDERHRRYLEDRQGGGHVDNSVHLGSPEVCPRLDLRLIWRFSNLRNRGLTSLPLIAIALRSQTETWRLALVGSRGASDTQRCISCCLEDRYQRSTENQSTFARARRMPERVRDRSEKRSVAVSNKPSGHCSSDHRRLIGFVHRRISTGSISTARTHS